MLAVIGPEITLKFMVVFTTTGDVIMVGYTLDNVFKYRRLSPRNAVLYTLGKTMYKKICSSVVVLFENRLFFIAVCNAASVGKNSV